MEIKITYVGFINNASAMTCGFKPDDMVVTEERQVLYADTGKILVKDGVEIGQAIWLKDGDTQDNYTEIDEVIEDENTSDNNN